MSQDKDQIDAFDQQRKFTPYQFCIDIFGLRRWL